jgi:hypothetical protein
MKRNVKFAIMKYIPDFERDEKINVAVMLHSPEDEFLGTKIIENWRRLKEFDDELDIDFMKSYLKTVAEEFNYNILIDTKIKINDPLLLEKMTQFYINQFSFVISEVNIETNCEEFLTKLKNNYLYYDVEKKKRVSQKESVEFFGELLRGKNITYELIGGKNCLLGNYNEKINVDLKINDKYYKVINFNDSNIDTYFPVIKMWMLNAIELNERKEKLVFVINEQVFDDKINTFVAMLSKYGEVIKLSEFSKYFK